MKRLAVLAVTACMFAAVGCNRCPETMLSLKQLVANHNANARAVPRLWARAKVQITRADKKGRSFTYGSVSPLAASNALLLYQRPPKEAAAESNFVLIGRELGQQVFRMGTFLENNGCISYLWLRFGGRGGAWYTRRGGEANIKGMPVDPTQLLAVLNICSLPADFKNLPAVALAMSKKPCAYVVTYIDRCPGSGEIRFLREIYFRWSDSEPPRPFMIKFFDASGRRVATAKLGKYKAIEIPDENDDENAQPAKASPVMPTDIDITWTDWPGRKNAVRRIRLVLSEMTTEDKFSPRAFRFFENVPAGIEPVSVDKPPHGGGEKGAKK